MGTEATSPTGLTELHHLLVESVIDYAIFVLDPAGHVVSWNPGAERLKGYAADEIIGRHFSIFYPEEEDRAENVARQLEIAARDTRFEAEGWRLRKDGSRFWANVVITALRDDRGELKGFAKITRDLTERRNAEEQARALSAEAAARAEADRRSEELTQLAEELQQQGFELESQTEEAESLAEELEEANEKLHAALIQAETANEAKMRFLAVMSHEFRTPLNAIAGYVELLRMGIRGPITSEQIEDLGRIARNQRALLGLVNDILNYARVEAGHIRYAQSDVRVAALLRDLESLILPQIQAKGLRVDFAACDDALTVLADGERVRQILLNVYSNAIKFTQSGGSIRTSCLADEDTVAIVVEDTGIGIPADQLEAIFEPFVQVDRSLTNIQEGAGLGLAISRELARAMHGELATTSAPGMGATFTLTLPRSGGGDGQT